MFGGFFKLDQFLVMIPCITVYAGINEKLNIKEKGGQHCHQHFSLLPGGMLSFLMVVVTEIICLGPNSLNYPSSQS